jgi:cellulose synthase/poly-beta-1,6-N-acetylglucosamine synthase-like glycosyltransferase
VILFGIGVFSLLAIAIIWFGYPLAVRILGGLRRQGLPAAGMPTSAVPVILASCEDADAIRARVTNLLQTDHPTALVEVVVALDAARAEAVPGELAGLGERVKVVSGDAPGGKSATLNAGVRAASHDVLVFADTAQRFDRDSIPALATELTRPGLGAVSGMLELPGSSKGSLNVAERYWRYERWLRLWEARVHSCVGVTGAIYAMRRELWEPLPANLILDDVYVPMRLVLKGWRVGFTEKARARDVRRFAPAQEYRRKVRTLTGVIQVCVWLPGVLNPVRNPIWLQFVFHKLLRLLTPYLAALAILGMAWAGVSALLSSRVGSQLLLALAVIGAALCLIPRVRRALKGQIAWGVALQSSIVVATVNGVRGRWDVWR